MASLDAANPVPDKACDVISNARVTAAGVRQSALQQGLPPPVSERVAAGVAGRAPELRHPLWYAHVFVLHNRHVAGECMYCSAPITVKVQLG